MAQPRPILVITGRHRPHELCLLLLSLMLGAAYTLGAPAPQSVAATMSPWIVHVWAAGLLISGVVGLPACLAPVNMRVGLRLELGAMLIGAGALVVTAASVISYTGWDRASLGIGLCATWAVANVVRAGQIRRDLREIEQAADG